MSIFFLIFSFLVFNDLRNKYTNLLTYIITPTEIHHTRIAVESENGLVAFYEKDNYFIWHIALPDSDEWVIPNDTEIQAKKGDARGNISR